MDNCTNRTDRTIRTIQADELDALLALYPHLIEADLPLPARAKVEAVWQELMANPRYRYFGVYVDNELVSSCTLTVVPNLTRACQPYGLIENVVTHAAHRGRGHGKALLAHALAYAWREGCYKAMLMTGRKDESTLGFYEAAGFDRHGKQAFIARPVA
jgi:GNAT superfamily N-acetyltransferase